MPWSRKFDDPIILPDGRRLETLRDAADYIVRLRKRIRDQDEWQTATRCLIEAAAGHGPMMFARIGMLQAMNHGKERPNPRKKAVKRYKVAR